MTHSNYERSLERYTEKIKTSEKISEQNKILILKFKERCFALGGRGTGRIVKYMWTLMKIAEMIDFDFDKATKEQMMTLVAEIRKSGLKEWTIHDYLVAIKCFYKDMFGEDGDYPKVVRFIKTNISREFKKEQEKDRKDNIISPEEIGKLVEAAPTIKWKAFIRLLFEMGARVSEILGIQNKHIVWEGEMVEVTISGKTGTRSWSVVESVPFMSMWKEVHPKGNDPNSYFFCSNGEGKMLAYSTVLGTLKDIAHKAGINKPVNPHAFRRASATYWSDHLKMSQLCDKYGWRQGSQIVQSYIYRKNKHKEVVAKFYDIGNTKEEKKETKPLKCQRCHNMNDHLAKQCYNCGFVFDVAMRINKRKKELVTDLVMRKVAERNPNIKTMIEEVANELSGEINKILVDSNV